MLSFITLGMKRKYTSPYNARNNFARLGIAKTDEGSSCFPVLSELNARDREILQETPLVLFLTKFLVIWTKRRANQTFTLADINGKFHCSLYVFASYKWLEIGKEIQELQFDMRKKTSCPLYNFNDTIYLTLQSDWETSAFYKHAYMDWWRDRAGQIWICVAGNKILHMKNS